MIGRTKSHFRIFGKSGGAGNKFVTKFHNPTFHELLPIFLFIFLSFEHLTAQEKLLPVFRFKQLTTTDGLSSSWIRSNVIRDHDGFLWVGTINGLERYDGSSFVRFQHDPDNPQSLPPKIVRSLLIDSHGRFWIGYWEGGLSLFDPVSGRCINFLPRQGDSSWLQKTPITLIREGRSGDIWLGGYLTGLVRMTLPLNWEGRSVDTLPDGVKFHTYSIGTSVNEVTDLYEDSDGIIFIASDSGLLIFNRETDSMSRPHSHGPLGRRINNASLTSLAVDSSGKLWIGSAQDGLFAYERRKGTVSNYRNSSSDDRTISGNDIKDIEFDRLGRLWIARPNGVDLFDCAAGERVPYLLSGEEPTSNGDINLVFDRSGALWVTSYNRGLYCLTPGSFRFPHFALRKRNGKPASMETIDNDKDGNLWIGTEGRAIKMDVPGLNVMRSLVVFPAEKELYGPGAWSSYLDREGNLWYGTWGLGLYRWDPRTGVSTNYRYSEDLVGHRPRANICLKIIQGQGDSLWIATYGDGLLKFDPRSGKFNQVLELDATHIMKDSIGKLWISNERDGIYVYDPSTGYTLQMVHKSGIRGSLSSDRVKRIYQDPKGRIWVGGANMIDLWEDESGSFRHFVNPAFKDAIYAEPLGCDSNGRIWINYLNKGLAVLDPETWEFMNFYSSDGLCGQPTVMSVLPDGKVILVGSDGMNLVHPDSLLHALSPPRLSLTRVTVNDKPIDLMPGWAPDNGLEFSHEDNTFEFAFVAIDPTEPHLVEYLYRLEGLERSWFKGVTGRMVRYSGLQSGKYTFRVKAFSARGEWPGQEMSLAFLITPPWWKTWWAYTFYGFIFIGLLFTGYRLRIKQLHLKQQMEMGHFQTERLAEVDKLKSRFFSNISHEFRTPLTLIIGPVDQAIETTQEPSTHQKLGLIKDNAKKLFGLVNQLLDFSRLESGVMKLQASNGDVVRFLRRVVMSFESWAERKKINLEFIAEKELVEGFFDCEKLEKIMNNLLSNALKFTLEGGSVSIVVNIDPTLTLPLARGGNDISPLIRGRERGGQKENEKKFLEITVTDTGPGIPAEHLPNIFNRFYRADNSHSVEGTGIGLALVWELTQLHHGTVTVESIMGKGTTFTVTIPIDKSTYLPEEIVDAPPETEKTVFIEPPSVHISSSTDIPTNGKPIVLIVEDNTDLRAYIREFLNADYAVYEAGDGKAGLEQATENIPDIVISDVMMPEMDGIELCKALKQDLRTSHIPVILLTARAGTDSKIEGLEIGADDYVTKPFDSKELLARVKNLIEQRRQLRKKFSAGVVLKPGEVSVTSLDDSLLKKVMDVVEKNLGDENFGVEELAREACLSQRHLARKLQALTNLKPSEFIQYVRLQRARELLQKNAGSIADIAYKVGFGSPSYFSSCFRERYGYPPSDVQSKISKQQ